MKRFILALVLGVSIMVEAYSAPVTYAVEGTWDAPAPLNDQFFVRYTYDADFLSGTPNGWLDFNSGTGGFSVEFVGDMFLESLVWDALRVSPTGTSTSLFSLQAWDFDRPGTGALELQFDEFGDFIHLGYSDNEISYDSFNPDVTFVPIPAAAWLFGSALGLLGWMRRRKAG